MVYIDRRPYCWLVHFSKDDVYCDQTDDEQYGESYTKSSKKKIRGEIFYDMNIWQPTENGKQDVGGAESSWRRGIAPRMIWLHRIEQFH